MSPARSDIPNPAVRRLSLYLRQLETLETRGVATVSSQKLAQFLNLTGAQVRKDLAYFGQFGRSGVGYEVPPLIARLKRILGTDKVSNTLLVGAGNMGRALSLYHGFRSKGFDLVALFDNDRSKIGKPVGQLVIQSLDQLSPIVRKYNIRLGIIAVPAEAAQFVADRLVAAGIRGILNFAPVQITAPPPVIIRHIDVASELEQLNFLTAE